MPRLPAVTALAVLAPAALALAACSGGQAPDVHAGHGHPAAAAPAVPAAAAPRGLTKLAAPSAGYPLTTCVVSGDPLGGDMGPAVAYAYDGTEVQFCCDACVEEFQGDPAAHVARVRAARR